MIRHVQTACLQAGETRELSSECGRRGRLVPSCTKEIVKRVEPGKDGSCLFWTKKPLTVFAYDKWVVANSKNARPRKRGRAFSFLLHHAIYANGDSSGTGVRKPISNQCWPIIMRVQERVRGRDAATHRGRTSGGVINPDQLIRLNPCVAKVTLGPRD